MLNRRISFLMLLLAALCFAVVGCGDDDENGGGGPGGGGGATVPGPGGGGGGPGPGGGGGDISTFCNDVCGLEDQCGLLDSDFTLADCRQECDEDLGFLDDASASCRSAADALAGCVTALNCSDFIEYLEDESPYPCESQEDAAGAACADEFSFDFSSFSSFSSFGSFSSFSDF